MIIIESTSTNAYFNIATEEYLLTKFPTEEILFLYINAPSIIVGKFQNTLAEINLDYVKENNILVVRRMSGGGTVYHDLGNLNFSFHSQQQGDDFTDFSRFTAPVINMLHKLHIDAKLEGRNDILVDGKKFSGNAKLAKSGKVIQHGTILINSEMDVLVDALKANPLKFIDKATKSNRSRVTNLIHYLPKHFTTKQFQKHFVEEIQQSIKNTKIYKLNKEDQAAIDQLVKDKYATWDWNFGFSPNYNFKKADKLKAGFIEVHLDVHKGYIKNVKIFGDFFARRPIEELELQLLNVRHHRDDIRSLLESTNVKEYFGNVEVDDLIDLFQ